MLFNSYEFLFLFLPVTLAGYAILAGRSHGLGLAWLTFVSLFFYGRGSPEHFALLIASVLGNFLVGRELARAKETGRPRPHLLVLGIAGNLALLGWFKYAVFLSTIAASVFLAPLRLADIALPVGISFFTFTQIAFLVDAHRGLAKEYTLLRYGLFVTFFPHLVAGPILHHAQIMPQFDTPAARDRHCRWDDLAAGFAFFAIGLAKKIILADNIAPTADAVFRANASVPLTFYEAWIGAAAYTLQIYFDFSGYSDMAVGLARMVGIRFPYNFNSPYQAPNIIEFWRRWHMTLSAFLRDYLYFSLGGSHRGRLRRYLNLMITMLLGGLWHGAGWTFVAWGALHGLYLMTNHAWRAMAGDWILARHPLAIRAGWVLTLLAVVVAWVPFRADSLDQAATILQAMFGFNGIPLPAPLGAGGSFAHKLFNPLVVLPFLAGLTIIAAIFPNSQDMIDGHLSRPEEATAASRLGQWMAWRPTARWGMILGFLAGICLSLIGGPSPFLYFRF
jgi:D-alanyl-lipoteichoic acid acyltransferase DltB (MBOAT superfamily)